MATASDSLNDTDGVALQDHGAAGTWTRGGAAYNLVFTSNTLGSASSSGDMIYYHSTAPATADQKSGATFTSTSPPTTPTVVVRASTDANNFYKMRFSNGVWQIYKRVSGTRTLVGSYTGDVPSSGLVGELRAVGTTISGIIGGVTRISVTDSDVSAANRWGVGALFANAGNPPNINDWYAEDVASGGTVYTRSLSESIAISDTPIRGRSLMRMAVEAMDLNDVVVASIVKAKILSDNISILDMVFSSRSVSRVIPEDIQILETLWHSIRVYRSAREEIGVYDDVARTIQAHRSAREEISISDVVARTLLTSETVRTLIENIGVFDTINRSLSISRQTTDNVELSDLLIRLANMARRASDDVRITDSIQSARVLGRVMVDAVDVVEMLLGHSHKTRMLMEEIYVADSTGRATSITRMLSHNIEVIDSIISSFVPAPTELTLRQIVMRMVAVRDTLVSLGNTDTIVDLEENRIKMGVSFDE